MAAEDTPGSGSGAPSSAPQQAPPDVALTRAGKRLRRALREQVEESHSLLSAGLQHKHGLNPAALAPLLGPVRAPCCAAQVIGVCRRSTFSARSSSPNARAHARRALTPPARPRPPAQDFYARLLGSLELCIVPVTFESPLTRYCAALSKAPRAEQLAGLDALRPIVEAVCRRTGTRLDASGELRAGARPPGAGGHAHPGYDSSDDDEMAAAAGVLGMPACGVRCAGPPGAAGAAGAAADAAGGGAGGDGQGGAVSAPPDGADAAAAGYSCFAADALCGPRTAASAPASEADAFSAWASDVGAFAAQAVSAALSAGSTVVMPACACPAYACRPHRGGIIDAVRSGVAAGGAGGLSGAVGPGAAVVAAAAAAVGPGPADAPPSAVSGVRWADAPERVCCAVATLAPALFADVAGVAMAPMASLLNHSCVPSCQLDTTPRGGITAVTLHDILPGDELTVAYVATAAPRGVRRRELRKHGFDCACARCVLDAGSVAELAPADVHALCRQAQEEGRYEDAEGLMRALLARPAPPGAVPDAEASHALGVCQLAQGRWEEAHATWAAAAPSAHAHASLKAQVDKDACYWPAEDAPTQASLRDAMCMVPTEDDMYLVPLSAPPRDDMAVVTRVPLLAAEDCARAVAAAEEAAAKRGGWTTARHYAVPTTDIPLHEVPSLLAWFNDVLHFSIAPMLAMAFPEISSPGRLRVHDAFIVRYAATSQRHLPVHRDQSQYSCTIALNARGEFTGGGTFFADSRLVICPDVGHVVAFPGETRHGGEPITAGVRYIIAAFLFLGSEDAAPTGAADNMTTVDF
jgi:hypothetical protein